jgi:hypothetical protein
LTGNPGLETSPAETAQNLCALSIDTAPSARRNRRDQVAEVLVILLNIYAPFETEIGRRDETILVILRKLSPAFKFIVSLIALASFGGWVFARKTFGSTAAYRGKTSCLQSKLPDFICVCSARTTSTIWRLFVRSGCYTRFVSGGKPAS